MHKKAQIGFEFPFCWILFGILLFNVLMKSLFIRSIDTRSCAYCSIFESQNHYLN